MRLTRTDQEIGTRRPFSVFAQANGPASLSDRRTESRAITKRLTLAHPLMTTARKYQLAHRSKPVPEESLTIEVRELLYAFELATPHVKKGGTYASRLADQQELALCLVDWAICECDRGGELLKAKTKPEIAR